MGQRLPKEFKLERITDNAIDFKHTAFEFIPQVVWACFFFFWHAGLYEHVAIVDNIEVETTYFPKKNCPNRAENFGI